MKRIFHFLFWILVILILVLIFGKSWGNFMQSFYFVSLLLPIVIGTSYFFNFFLVPRYLLQGRYGFFVLYLVYTIIVSLYLEMVVLMFSFIYMANFDLGKMGIYASDSLVLAIVLYLVVFSSSFVLMVVQIYSNQKQIASLKSDQNRNNIEFLVVRADRKNRQIELQDLLYIESRGDYLILVAGNDSQVLTREKISHIGQRLPDYFVRIHRSFIVNRDKVTSFNHEEVLIQNIHIPLSRTYKAEALRSLAGSGVEIS